MYRKKIKFHERAFIYKRDNYSCLMCGIRANKIPEDYDGRLTLKCGDTILVLDHIIPYSMGGQSCKENYQTLCDRCNGKKGTKIMILHGKNDN